MTIGVCGPVDLGLLEYQLEFSELPNTAAFPLVSHFVNGLLNRGFKVNIYTTSIEVEESVVFDYGQLKICIAPQRPQPGRRFFRYEINALKNLILENPSDVISSFWSYEFGLAALKTGIPTIVSLHDVATVVLKYHMDMFRAVRWIMDKMVVAKAKYLIANSAYTYSSLSKRIQAKTEIINNFYTNSLLSDVPTNVEKQNYIITVAQGFGNRKNITTSLKAFSILRKSDPTLEYYLVGVDSEEGGLAHQYARKHGLDKGVKFIGPKPFKEVLNLITHAKVLIHPSLEESFGMVILEAMVIGTAVVGGEKSGYVPYLLDFGNVGKLCDVTSPESIAITLSKLLANEENLNTLVKRAKVFAERNYAEDSIIEQHIAYLKRVWRSYPKEVADIPIEISG
ncbi:glycosyltransferase [Pontibacter sp. KCTC 32443]|uniref:glycosyltransferase family 4 protein n=1 Tax=Pontibacter TaxID=323449 RepID=UPI00164EC69E|nr:MULTISPECIES: glycosyltransferase [Pontibacter]MBC5772973.1 glycosyltransferase [Pontibacter sp. KCTC 32443]